MIGGRVNGFVRGLEPSLALLAALAFMTQIGVAIMLPLLPLYATQLGATPTVLGLLTSVFAITNASGQMVAGWLSDRFGPRRLIPAGMAIYAGCNLLIATAASALPLILWRGVAGLGGGTTIVSERIFVRRAVAEARLGAANGILSAAGSAGQVIGPAIGGLIAAVSDLRIPFVVVGLTSSVAAAAALLLPRPDPVAAAPRPAAPAASATSAASAADEPPRGPLLSGPLFSGPLGILLLANLGLMGGYGAFITTYAPFATERLGYGTAQIGILFTFFGVGSIVLGPVLGHLGDRRGHRQVGAVSVVPIAVFALALVGAVPQLLLYPIAVAAGGGIAGFSAAWFSLLGMATSGRGGGRAFGTVSALSSLGIVVGALAATALWESVEIRAGMLVTVAALVVAGLSLLAYRPGTRTATIGG